MCKSYSVRIVSNDNSSFSLVAVVNECYYLLVLRLNNVVPLKSPLKLCRRDQE